MNNNLDEADATTTILHEATAHYGLRKMFGKDFEKFLYNVFSQGTEDVRRKIAGMMQKNGLDLYSATEEYLAGLAESQNFTGVAGRAWQTVKSLFRDMLRGMGLVSRLSDTDLRDILLDSYDNLTSSLENNGATDLPLYGNICGQLVAHKRILVILPFGGRELTSGVNVTAAAKMLNNTIVAFHCRRRSHTSRERCVLILELIGSGNRNHPFKQYRSLVPSRVFFLKLRYAIILLSEGLSILSVRSVLILTVSLKVSQRRRIGLYEDKVNAGSDFVAFRIGHIAFHISLNVFDHILRQSYVGYRR